ncbi:helix-turn-helix domain-containing protein [Mesorhizobium sp. M6A.T.Cr.TU.016.01.1.1]|uniref:helix-turn-helix domain-containing protein n=1 Tax=Mesorhizobium sp. M6A.T.Cr.TU.016.01.1.1 TaxID=2493677 RepID=UPI001FE080AF|nr:helix-turn-helix domain-containing protein [Mesorhizobium sp. M6A.T.Cr.TU.016.01.1.1]
MPKRRRLTMRQLRQLLRLSADGISVRDIATMLGIARTTVQDNIERATAAGLSWPLPAELTEMFSNIGSSPVRASSKGYADASSLTGAR